MANKIYIETELDLDNVIKSVMKAQKEFDSAAKGMEKSIGVLDIAIGSMLGNLATDAVKNFGEVLSDTFDFLVIEGVKAAKEQEDAINDLNIALSNTGKFSKQTQKDLLDYASAMQSVTVHGDEVITSTMAMIQTIGNLEGKALKEATTAALDLSAALKIDLSTAAMMVGKAAQGEVGSFSKLGIEIQKGKDDAETFANALTTLQTKFGGAATGQVNTFSGSLAQTKNILSDVQEEVGNLIIKNPGLISAFQEAGKIFAEFGKKITENKEEISRFITLMAGISLESFKFVMSTVSEVVEKHAKNIMGLAEAYKEYTLQAGASKEDNAAQIDRMRLLKEKQEEVRKSLALLTVTEIERAEGRTRLLPGEQAYYDQLIKKDKELRDQIRETNQTIDENTKKNIAAKKAEKEAEEKLKKDQEAQAELLKKQKADEEIKRLREIREKERQDEIKREVEEERKKNEELLKLRQERLFMEQELKIIQDGQNDIYEDERFQRAQEILGERQAIEEVAKLQALESMKADQATIEKATLDFNKKLLDAKKKNALDQLTITKLTRDEELKLISDSFGKILELTKTLGKENTLAAQVAGVAQATIDTYVGATAALKLPPPYGSIQAGIIIAQGLANVAKISGVKFAQGGIVPGNSYSGDKVLTMQNSREMDLNMRQQRNLFDAINGNKLGGGGTVINIQGNVIADDDSAVDNMIQRINERILYGNASVGA